MNRRSVVTCLITVLLFISGVIAGEVPLLKDKEHSSGNSDLQKKKIRLQEYNNGIPRYGNYYEWDGSKWQRYTSDIPELGSYLKEVRPEGTTPETQEAK
jgi:hypothetical protein